MFPPAYLRSTSLFFFGSKLVLQLCSLLAAPRGPDWLGAPVFRSGIGPVRGTSFGEEEERKWLIIHTPRMREAPGYGPCTWQLEQASKEHSTDISFVSTSISIQG